MNTSSLPSSTSQMPSKALRSIKRSPQLLSNRGSRNTATSVPSVPSSCESKTISRPSSDRVVRHRWLIQQLDTGNFLASIKDGKPLWVSHPTEALTHTSMEVACSNLHKLREFYKIEGIRLEPINFYAYPERPTQWFTDYD